MRGTLVVTQRLGTPLVTHPPGDPSSRLHHCLPKRRHFHSFSIANTTTIAASSLTNRLQTPHIHIINHGGPTTPRWDTWGTTHYGVPTSCPCCPTPCMSHSHYNNTAHSHASVTEALGGMQPSQQVSASIACKGCHWLMSQS